MKTFEENNSHNLKSVILENVHGQYKEYKLLFLAAIYNFPGTWWVFDAIYTYSQEKSGIPPDRKNLAIC